MPDQSSNDSDEIVPHFALPTTSHVIRHMAESPIKAKIVVEAHKQFVKELRDLKEPAIRYPEPFKPRLNQRKACV